MKQRSMTGRFVASAIAILALDAVLAFSEVACTKAKDPPPASSSPSPTKQGASPTAPTQAKAPTDTTPVAPTTIKPDDTPPPADAPCDSLSRRKCLLSSSCTLELASGNLYRCRADKGVCEVGIMQTDAQACAAKAECTFDAGGCYCQCEGAARTETVDEPQSGCKCACGGGKPPMCVAK